MKVVLTVVAVVMSLVGFAQDNAKELQQITSNYSVNDRITQEMSNDDLRSEFMNNFFKIELADLILTNDIKGLKSIENEGKNSIHAVENKLVKSNQSIISDIAIRTTAEMRASLHSTEEIIA